MAHCYTLHSDNRFVGSTSAPSATEPQAYSEAPRAHMLRVVASTLAELIIGFATEHGYRVRVFRHIHPLNPLVLH